MKITCINYFSVKKWHVGAVKGEIPHVKMFLSEHSFHILYCTLQLVSHIS